MEMGIFEKAPAKINLSLDVLGKRDDGYHDVEMVMTTIDLADRIELTPLNQDDIHISIESQYVPSDERNLAYQAALMMKDKYNISSGVHIQIEKSIPVSAGLGGGSSNAAAVLRGLNRLWNLKISTHKLAEIGALIGTDVPFCVYNCTALATGRGEQITLLNKPPSSWVILAKPNIGVSTKTIFNNLVNLEEIGHPNTTALIQALQAGDFSNMCLNLHNVLEQTTFNIYPEVKRIKEKMVQAGAVGVTMSGSGPTIYTLVEQESKAKRIYNGLRGFCHEVFCVRMLG